MKVVAINTDTYYPLEEWVGYWERSGGGEVVWAQDTGGALKSYEVLATGTKIIIDRDGRVAFRVIGRSSFERLSVDIESLL